jgi:hypothetical protein
MLHICHTMLYLWYTLMCCTIVTPRCCPTATALRGVGRGAPLVLQKCHIGGVGASCEVLVHIYIHTLQTHLWDPNEAPWGGVPFGITTQDPRYIPLGLHLEPYVYLKNFYVISYRNQRIIKYLILALFLPCNLG